MGQAVNENERRKGRMRKILRRNDSMGIRCNTLAASEGYDVSVKEF